MNTKVVILRNESIDYLENCFQKRMKQIRKRYAAKILQDFYDLDEKQVNSKLCEIDQEYKQIDSLRSQILD